jgi:cytochrome c peroxidase
MNVPTGALRLAVFAGTALLGACSSEPSDEPPDGPLGEAASASSGDPHAGAALFYDALPGTNGRACGTCHVGGSGHFALSVPDVAARLAANPHDPLFNPIDADDPGASPPTYQHLGAGLVRVTLDLAPNLDVIDASGHVVTCAARTVGVWRAVPTVENTASTAPYQLDGRIATLPDQADAALLSHSQIDHAPTKTQLEDLAAFESTVYSDLTAELIGIATELGLPPPELEPHFPKGSTEAAGQALFGKACAPCHGTPTMTHITNPAIHDQLHPVLNADGSLTVVAGPGGKALPAKVHVGLQGHPMVNLGIAFGTYLTQTGALPSSTGVSFPEYRIRFYTDASRTHKLVDLPPLPPALGPTGSPQAFSVDPGRAITTGDPLDWEAFDVPQLRGVKHTAPYFHDNLAADLPAVLDIYSRFILGGVPQLGLPGTLPPEGPGLPPEALSPEQKTQIIAFLEQL